MTPTIHNNISEKHLDSYKEILNVNGDISKFPRIQQKNEAQIYSTDVTCTANINNTNEYYNHNTQTKISSCIIHRMYPEYPRRAKTLGIEGDVSIMYDINNLGKVENIRILSAHPLGVFEKNVRSAMRFWIYKANIPKKDLIVTFKFCCKFTEILDCATFKE